MYFTDHSRFNSPELLHLVMQKVCNHIGCSSLLLLPRNNWISTELVLVLPSASKQPLALALAAESELTLSPRGMDVVHGTAFHQNKPVSSLAVCDNGSCFL